MEKVVDKICNIYCSSTAKVVTRTRQNITLIRKMLVVFIPGLLLEWKLRNGSLGN